MKTLLKTIGILIFTISLIPPQASAQNWTTVGSDGFTGVSYYNRLAIDENNVPYVGYLDFNSGLKVSVMKYDGTSWWYVGNPGFSAMATNPALAIYKSTPYVIYSQATGPGDVSVMKNNGTGWALVGAKDFSGNGASDPDIAIDITGTPYALYNDKGTPYWNATVKKFDGTNWVTVGAPGFSKAQAMNNHIKIDKNGTPYVVYQDGGNLNHITVMKFNETGWINVGTAGFSGNAISHCNIAFSSTNVPYVVYNEFNGTVDKVIVKSFNGTSWVNVGSTVDSRSGLTWFNFTFSNIVLDANDVPYVSYEDNSNGGKAVSMKFTGSSWVAVGSTPFTAAKSDYLSMAMDGNGKLYAAYQDANASTKSTVKCYTTLTGIKEQAVNNKGWLTVYPNPASEIVNLTTDNIENKNISIINSIGQVVYSEQTSGGGSKINTSELPTGIYFVKLSSESGTMTRKLVIE